jgi:hypothetical protein
MEWVIGKVCRGRRLASKTCDFSRGAFISMVRPTLVGSDHQTSTAISRTGPCGRHPHEAASSCSHCRRWHRWSHCRTRPPAASFHVDVFEQAKQLREVGAGVQLSANGSRALYALGIGKTLADLSCEATAKCSAAAGERGNDYRRRFDWG